MPADARSDSVSGAPATQYVDATPSTEAPPEIDPQATYVVKGQQMSGEELINQRLMHADYTRKTQTIAGERSKYEAATQLLTMLQTDPSGTLAQLAEHYGVDLGGYEPSPASGPQFEPEGDELEQDDPRFAALSSRVQELDAFAQQQLEQQAEQYMAAQMEKTHALADRLGLEVDEEELFSFAFQNNYVDPLAAFLRLNADELPERAGRKAVEEYTAKRGLPVSRTSLNRAPAERAQPKQPARNIREALEQALDAEGLTDMSEVTHNLTYTP